MALYAQAHCAGGSVSEPPDTYTMSWPISLAFGEVG